MFFLYTCTDEDKSTDGDSLGNSLYASQGAIPKASPRKRNEISSKFGRKMVTKGAHKHNLEHSFQKKATDMIESWTWGNQPGMSLAHVL